MLVFFEAAVKNIEKMANLYGWWCGCCCCILVENSALLEYSWMITWVLNIYYIILVFFLFLIYFPIALNTICHIFLILKGFWLSLRILAFLPFSFQGLQSCLSSWRSTNHLGLWNDELQSLYSLPIVLRAYYHCSPSEERLDYQITWLVKWTKCSFDYLASVGI